MSAEPWSPASFEVRYQHDPDPWDFASSSYEQGRYRSIMGALPRPRYRSAYEPGCSIGELSVMLAGRCERLTAVDVSATAVAQAQRRCADLPGVDVAVGSVTDPRDGRYDLVVMSEIGYYFTEPRLDRVIDLLVGVLEPGGDLVACHWTGASCDHILSGAQVHAHLAARTDLVQVSAEDHEGFLLAAWTHR